MNNLSTKYDIIKCIGKGAFGKVYKAINKDNKLVVAIKVEENTTSSRLEYEYSLYRSLSDISGLPNIYDFIKTKSDIICVMDYLGPSLQELLEFCNGTFTLKTTLMIAIQIINRIEAIHNAGIIHRDIKPDNFLIGSGGNKSKIYIIDLGLAKRYIIGNNQHIEYRSDKKFTGSFRYSSIRNHKGLEQSRRDDLESIGYMLIYLLKGKLPWQGLPGSTKSKRSKKIFSSKMTTTLNELCEDIPREFLLYMRYCKILRFKQTPDYDLIRNLFVSLFKKSKFENDNIYDWNIIARQKKDTL